MKGLGVRQRKMLVNMAVYGNCGWPKQWQMRNDDRSVLVALHRKDLVTATGFYAALTAEGEGYARALMSEAEHRLATRLGSPICVHAVAGVQSAS